MLDALDSIAAVACHLLPGAELPFLQHLRHVRSQPTEVAQNKGKNKTSSTGFLLLVACWHEKITKLFTFSVKDS